MEDLREEDFVSFDLKEDHNTMFVILSLLGEQMEKLVVLRNEQQLKKKERNTALCQIQSNIIEAAKGKCEALLSVLQENIEKVATSDY